MRYCFKVSKKDRGEKRVKRVGLAELERRSRRVKQVMKMDGWMGGWEKGHTGHGG